jgi:putative DNA primase/helicase
MRRGLWQEPVPPALRYHPHLYYRDDDGSVSYHPALIAAVQAPTGTAVTLHRIYLATNGQKAAVSSPKKSMPGTSPMTGAAVRLDPAGATLAVTEGIETGLAVRLSTGLPVWAAVSAGGMAELVLPETVREVIICPDHDISGTGEKAAKKLARRLLAEGRRVKILMPSTPGTDWADTTERAQHG